MRCDGLIGRLRVEAVLERCKEKGESEMRNDETHLEELTYQLVTMPMPLATSPAPVLPRCEETYRQILAITSPLSIRKRHGRSSIRIKAPICLQPPLWGKLLGRSSLPESYTPALGGLVSLVI